MGPGAPVLEKLYVCWDSDGGNGVKEGNYGAGLMGCQWLVMCPQAASDLLRPHLQDAHVPRVMVVETEVFLWV